MGNDTSSWRSQRNGLLHGSVLAPVLFNLYSNNLPVTRGQKFIYADDICFAIQGQYFSELECSLTSDMARMSHFCRQWWLKPSASKTISSVFHLHNTVNTSTTHERQFIWMASAFGLSATHLSRVDSRPYAVLHRTLDKDCRQAASWRTETTWWS